MNQPGESEIQVTPVIQETAKEKIEAHVKERLNRLLRKASTAFDTEGEDAEVKIVRLAGMTAEMFEEVVGEQCDELQEYIDEEEGYGGISVNYTESLENPKRPFYITVTVSWGRTRNPFEDLEF